MVSIVTVDCHVLYNYAGVFTPPGQISHTHTHTKCISYRGYVLKERFGRSGPEMYNKCGQLASNLQSCVTN